LNGANRKSNPIEVREKKGRRKTRKTEEDAGKQTSV
jgi:hypothetical protein